MKKKDVIEQIDLNSLPGNHEVGKMDFKQLETLSAQLRSEIIDATSVYGGHLSSNLGDVEAVVALHHCFDFSKDKLIFDVGHQCYAHKILSGRKLENLRQKGGIAGFQKRNESIYDPYEAGHSSTSISAAEAFAIARDNKGEKYDVIAFIGDASIVNGLALEALNSLGNRKNKVIIVLNDNDMSISRPAGGIGKFFSKISTSLSYNKIKHGYQRLLCKSRPGTKIYLFSKRIKDRIKRRLIPITMFDNMGFSYIGPVDGHDIKALVKAFKRAKRADKSVVIHLNTIKGRGYAPCEGDKDGLFHDVGPFHKEDGTPLNTCPGKSWSQLYAEMVEERLEKDEQSYLVVAATQLGSKLTGVMEKYPSKCIDMGIAEEHAFTFSGALALNGYHPIVSIYSTFLQRAYDELAHDCARMNTPLTILIDRAGLVGENGETHQGIYDVAMLLSIPNVRIAMPSDSFTAKAVFEESMDYPGITAIRYPKGSAENAESMIPYVSKRYRYAGLNQNHDIALITVGPKFHEVIASIKEKGLEERIEVIDPVYLFPLIEGEVKKLLDYKQVIIYDAYGIEGGFANALHTKLVDLGYTGIVKKFAAPLAFLYQAKVSQLEEDLGLSVAQVIEKISDDK